MPQAVPLIVSAAASYAGLTATATFFVTAFTSIAVGTYEASRAKRRARDAYNSQLQDRLVPIRSGVAARRYVLGTCRVTGTVLYGDSVGPDKTALDIVTAMAANKCTVLAHYLDDERIEPGDFPGDKFGKLQVKDLEEFHTVTGPSTSIVLASRPRTASDCKVYSLLSVGVKSRAGASVSFTLGSGSTINLTGLPGGTSNVRVVYKALSGLKLESHFITGSDSEAAHAWPTLSTPLWTSAHRARGICGFRTLYRWDQDIYAERGAPAHGAVLKGGSLDTHPFYDPRNGSNPTYTSNPALLAYWWATLPRNKGACGIPSSWINPTYVAAAANVCDELITVRKLDGSGYEQVKRYEFHGDLSTEDDPLTNLRKILSAMNGKMPFTAGEYRMFAGAFRSATLTITDADVVGTEAMVVATGGDIDNAPNVVTATFADATNHYQPNSPAPVINSTYISSDGHEEPLDLTLPGTTDPRQAHYLMGVELESRRPAMSVALRVGGVGENIAIGDTVQLSLTNRSAYTGKTFEVIERVDLWDGSFDLKLQEMKSTTWALDPDSWTPSDPPAIADTSFLWNVDPPTGFTVVQGTPQLLPDGTSVGRLDLSWDAATQEYVVEAGQHNLRYRRIGDNGQWVTMGSVPGDATSTTLTAALEDSDVYQFQLQAQNGIGARSEWVDAFVTIAGALVAAANGWSVDSEGKPAGWRGIESAANRTQIAFSGAAVRVTNSPDNSVAYGLPAIPIDDSATYTLTIRHKSSAASATGLYLRFSELNSALSSGTTHVGISTGEPGIVATRTSFVDLRSNGPMPGTSYVEESFTYVPSAGTKFASFGVYNWDLGSAMSYDIEWARLTKVGSNVNLLTQGAGAGADGASAFTLVNVANMRLTSPSSVEKTSANAWNGKARTAEAFTNGASISCTVVDASGGTGLGLTTDPTVDSNYTSVDYWMHLGTDGTLYVFRNGTGVTSSLASYSVGDRLTVTSDNARVRYFKNGTLLYSHDVTSPDEVLFGVVNAYYPGGVVSSIAFGPGGGADGRMIVGRGYCVVGANSIQKVGGGNDWNADAHSVRGYEKCHVRFKASQINQAVMVGLNSDPTASVSWEGIDYCFYCSDTSSELRIYESGALIGSYGTYTTSTVLELRYDGTNVHYYKDGALIRTSGAGGVLFFDSSFWTDGCAINSLVFGPGTVPGQVGTPQIEDNAATVVYTDELSTLSSFPALNVLEVAPGEPGTYEITFSCAAKRTGGSGSDSLSVLVSASGGGSLSGATNQSWDTTAAGQTNTFSMVAIYTTSGTGPWAVRVSMVTGGGLGTFSASALSLRVTVVKK